VPASSSRSEIAESLDGSLAHVEIEGSLFLLSNPRLRPREFLVLRFARGCTCGPSSANESVGDEADISGEECELFNQAPSLSTRLPISIEDRFFGACSTMAAMLPALSERCEVRTGGEPILITEEMLLFTEWLLLVLNDPSDEITESGLGMISTFSEKPTQRRDPGLIGEDSRELVSVSSPGAERSSGGAAAGSSAGWPNGVLGKLVLSLGKGSSEGTIMLLMS
jgi:hypothetical protein